MLIVSIITAVFTLAVLALSIALVVMPLREMRAPRTPRDTVRNSRTHAQRASLTAQDMRAEQAIADATAQAYEETHTPRAHNAHDHYDTAELSRAVSGSLSIVLSLVENGVMTRTIMRDMKQLQQRAHATDTDALCLFTDYAQKWCEGI